LSDLSGLSQHFLNANRQGAKSAKEKPSLFVILAPSAVILAKAGIQCFGGGDLGSTGFSL